jgi:hypothetical protein
MLDHRAGHGDELVLHHEAAAADLVRVDERRQRRLALVLLAHLQVLGVHLEEDFVMCASGGGPHVSTRVFSGSPHASSSRFP